MCIGQLPNSSSLLSGPGLSPPPPNRFRLVVHSRTQSVPVVNKSRKTSGHQHAREFSPGTESAGTRRPSYANDAHTPGLFLKGREEDVHKLVQSNNSEDGQTQHRHSDNHHRSVRCPSANRLRNLCHPEQGEPVREEGKRARRGGSRITPSPSHTTSMRDTQPAFLKAHRRQRTGVKLGSVKDRITSFETLSERPSTAPALRREGAITPPLFYPARAGRGQLNKFMPGDELQQHHTQPPSTPSCSEDDLDLPIENNELLTMNTSRPRGHARSQTMAAVPRRDITTAASILHEPACHDYHGHSRSQSTPSPTRLVPVNSHHTMFPSAFRMVTIEQERPGSAGSMTSTSTMSDTGPSTPRRPSTSTGNSWFAWSPFSARKKSPSQSPVPSSATGSSFSSTGSTLSPLKPDSDDWGFFDPKRGLGDHWADNATSDHHTHSPARTLSKQIRWDDEDSVKFSWF